MNRATARMISAPGAILLAALVVLPLRAAPPVPPWESALNADHPLAGTIYAPDGDAFTPKEMLDAAARHGFVILGERHDNPDHHAIQAWVLEDLVKRGRRPAVVFEMFTQDDQPAIDAFLAEDPPNAADLGKAVNWGETGWPDWSLYRPIADIAVAHDLPIIAGNATDTTVDAVVKSGGLDALPARRRRALRLDKPISKTQLTDLRRDIRDAHCDMLPDGMIGAMAAAQRLRDAALAEAMAQAAEKPGIDGALLITGTGHARRDRAVPFYLERQGVESREIYSIAAMEVAADLTEPATYAERRGGTLPYDAVWFTARAEREDPCQAMRDQMKGGKKSAE